MLVRGCVSLSMPCVLASTPDSWNQQPHVQISWTEFAEGRLFTEVQTMPDYVKYPSSVSSVRSLNSDWMNFREGNTKWEDLNLDDIDMRMKWAGMFHRRKRTPGKFMMRLKVGMAARSVMQLWNPAYQPITPITVLKERQPEILHVAHGNVPATAFPALQQRLEAVRMHQAPARPGRHSTTCAVAGAQQQGRAFPQPKGLMSCCDLRMVIVAGSTGKLAVEQLRLA